MKQAVGIAFLAIGIVAACADTPPVTPIASAPLIAPASSAPASEPTATPTAAASPAVICGRTEARDCEKAIDLVRAAHPREVAEAFAIVVDDVCPPGMMCKRRYRFDSLVVLVPRPGASGAQLAFEVFGSKGPERVETWPDALPAHIVALVPKP